MAAQSNILLIPLFQRLSVTTNGASQSPTKLDLNVPQVRTLLPQASAIFLIGLTEQVAATDLEWNVAFYSAFDRDHQPVSPINIAATPFSAVAPNGQRSADYNTVTDFLPDTRLQVWWQNKLGISGAKLGLLSAILGVRLST